MQNDSPILVSRIASPFFLTAFKNAPKPQICPKLVRAVVFGGSSQGGLEFVKNLTKFEKQ